MKKRLFLKVIFFILVITNSAKPFNLKDILLKGGNDPKCRVYLLNDVFIDMFPSGILICYDPSLDENHAIVYPTEVFHTGVYIADDIHGAYLGETFQVTDTERPKPTDIFLFWYTPSGLIDIENKRYSSLSEVPATLKEWSFEKSFHLNAFFPLPERKEGLYLFFQGVKLVSQSHKFSWDGWIYVFIEWSKAINPDFSCAKFDIALSQINSLDDLADYISYEHYLEWNITVPPNTSAIDRIKRAFSCSTLCSCDNDNWRLTCTQVANFIIEVFKRKGDKLGVRKAWIVGIHGNALEDPLRCGHAFVVFETKDAKYGLMDAYRFIMGVSVSDVLKKYASELYLEKGWECFKRISKISFRAPFRFSHGIDILPFESTGYDALVQFRGIITSKEAFGVPGWFIASWKWITKNELTATRVQALLGF